MKYAVKVKLTEHDWIYVTEDLNRCDFELRPLLFETEEQAELFVQGWRIEGKEEAVQVVEFSQQGDTSEH